MENYQTYNGLEISVHDGLDSENLELLKRNGYFILESIFTQDETAAFSGEIDRLWDVQLDTWGDVLLERIGDWGQVRGMMKYSDVMLKLITDHRILKYVDLIIGDTAILHLQNGIILFPGETHNQAKYHKDFPKDFVASKLLSLNTFISVDDFTEETGGTFMIPGSHIFSELPGLSYIKKK